MKKLKHYAGFLLASALSFFCIHAYAGTVDQYFAAHMVQASADPQVQAMDKLELTLAQWRATASDTANAARSDMRAEGQGFVFNSVQNSRIATAIV